MSRLLAKCLALAVVGLFTVGAQQASGGGWKDELKRVYGTSHKAIGKIGACREVGHLKRLIDHVNKAIASGSAAKMAKVLNKMGAHVSKKQSAGGATVLKVLIQRQEGVLYTSLKLSEAACHARAHLHTVKKAESHVKAAVHHVASAITHAFHHHKHLVCKHWGHGRHRHYACRMR